MASYSNNPSLDADMENFLDFNGGAGGLQSPTSAVDNLHADEHQVFSGPSHEYDRFRQQTGLPAGAISSINSFADVPGDNDFLSQSGLYADTSAGYSSIEPGYGLGFNFDMDYESTPQSAVPSYFLPSNNPAGVHDFAESSQSGAQGNAVVNHPRLWPGSHSQQAEQARAEAQARQQRQQQHGRNIMQQRQREQSVSASSQVSGPTRKTRAGSQTGTDPRADEHISRILDHMRHNSTVSTIEEEQNSMDESAARTARMKKDEEDMDEDERLLASEEGKKLSSKERRQLRNKVSARAFRSRRKEYITQLEGEVANKADECNELRLTARKLTEENNQLKHLTRTLLSHPAFQNFLEDMSRDPTFVAPVQPSMAPELAPNASNGNEQNNDASQHDDLPAGNDNPNGMGAVQQNPLDLSMLNLGQNHWSAGNGGFSFQQPQVFAVHEVPEGPTYEEIMAPRLSEKLPEADIPEIAMEAAELTEVESTEESEATCEWTTESQHVTEHVPVSSPQVKLRTTSSLSRNASMTKESTTTTANNQSFIKESSRTGENADGSLFRGIEARLVRIRGLNLALLRG